MRIVKIAGGKRMVIVRGLPGSGKSTLAKQLGKGGVVLSSDDFFMVNGKYEFDLGSRGYAHVWNQGRARQAASQGASPIVIDNTNVTWGADIAPYAKIAQAFGYEVEYAEPDTPWKFDVDELASRNAHNVPREAIQRMLDKWQPTETLGMDKQAASSVDVSGFARSGRLTADEQELFDVLKAVVKAKTPGTTVRAVGGWVRDKLLGITPKDLDIMVDDIGGPAFASLVTGYLGMSDPHVIRANPDQSKNIETARMYVKLPSSGKEIEVDVAQARQDAYQGDSRIPVTTLATPQDDAARRDLTINAVFYDIHADEVEDFTGMGIGDLNGHVVRTPLDPAKTFNDDPLRMLRCIRFAARYGWDIDQDTKAAIFSPAMRQALRRKVSRDRKGIELKDMLSSGFPEVAVELLIDSGIFEDLLADAVAGSEREGRMAPVTMDQNNPHHNLTWNEHVKALARGLARKYRGQDKDKVFQVMMGALLHDAGKLDSASRQQKENGTTSYHGHEDASKDIAEQFMRFVKLEPYSKPVEAIVQSHMRPHDLTRYHSNATALRRFIRNMMELGIDWKDVINMAASDAMAKGGEVQPGVAENYARLLEQGATLEQGMTFGKGVKPVVNGRDIMETFGVSQGVIVGQMINAVKEMMDEDQGITKEEAIAKLRAMFPNPASNADGTWLDRGRAEESRKVTAKT